MNSDLSELKPIHRSRLLVIRSLIEGYEGAVPFHQYLKSNFSKNRQYGSADRRIYREWSYAWFRIGKSIPEEPFFNRLIVGYFIIHGLPDDFSSSVANLLFDFKLNLKVENTLEKRISHISNLFPSFQTDDLFPFNEALSNGIDRKQFALSMLVQPDVFIRIAEGKKELVKMECNQQAILFREQVDLPNCLTFEASVKLEKLPSRENGYFEIQDRSSQIAGNAIPANDSEKWWDCCCGAGGKSLQLLQTYKDIRLTASDIRTTIIENFASRLSKVNAGKVRLVELDLVNDEPLDDSFDGIIADVPCSGSGTWARTPEKLTYFNIAELKVFSEKQKSIVTKAVNCLRPGGKLMYITCSVFKIENEDVALWIRTLNGMQLLEQKSISGLDSNSDSMFYAIFGRN